MQPQNERRAAPFAVTVGEGKTNPQGIYTPCEPSVTAVAEILRQQPSTIERWWSMHLWAKNKRNTKAWQASSGIVIDIDYRKPDLPPPDLVEQLRNAATSDELPGAVFHLTPHGARIVWVYENPCSDRQLQIKAERGAATLAAKALETLSLTEYQVDAGLVGELARFFYTPNSVAKGVKRSDQVLVMREELANPVDLAVFDVAARVVEEPKAQKKPPEFSEDWDKAVKAWNEANAQEWPKNSAQCPICNDNGSFGQLPEDTTRWCCFSSDHTSIGIKGDKVFHGDALDLEAFKRGCKPIDVLRKDGYWKKRPSQPPPRTEADMPPEFGEESFDEEQQQQQQQSKKEKAIGSYRSRSYRTAVDIISKNDRNVLEDQKLELNEMSGDIEIGRKPIKDADAHKIRYLIEARFVGGLDKNNNQIGLQLSSADVFAAIAQVASDNPYHPVREYLTKLTWDGLERINTVVSLLGAEESEINQILVKRFFISAVARPLDPGKKSDTVFILVGPQGARKSSFFDVLSDPWFIDTPIDITGDAVRAYMTLRKAWLLEWAELEAMLRAKRHTAIKAFLSSKADSYVPKHARFDVKVPRGGIIVGTTNTTEFLEDDTGERRYWPISVGFINLEGIAAIRDQLWAEAVHYFRQGERWWLTPYEERLLAPRHKEHRVTDVWEDRVLDYALKTGSDNFTTADVLQHEILKDMGQWTRGDEMRISKILKNSGYIRVTDPKNLSRKVWRTTSGQL